MPDDDQIGPNFGRNLGNFRDGIAKLHADLGCQPHGGKSLMAFVEDLLEIGLLVGVALPFNLRQDGFGNKFCP